MVRVEVSESAARELHERVRSRGPLGLAIQPGPAHEQYQGPEWTPDDESLAPPQRWVLLPIGNQSFENIPESPAGFVSIVEVRDFKVMIFFPPTTGVLNIGLVDGTIRVYETDA